MSLIFEFDSAKSASNKEKHGIDFDEAQRLWADEGLLIVPTQFVSEMRWIAVGMIDDKHWTVIFTLRQEMLRIISVRRSRDYEIENYFFR